MITFRNDKVSRITIFPNPVKTQLTISNFGQKVAQYKAQIVDQTGKVFKQFRLTSGTQKVPVNNLAVGLYFLSIETGETFKFMVE